MNEEEGKGRKKIVCTCEPFQVGCIDATVVWHFVELDCQLYGITFFPTMLIIQVY